MAAMIANDPIKLRRVMAMQFEDMEGQMAGLADKSGKSTLLTERNRKAFEVLDRELKAGKSKYRFSTVLHTLPICTSGC